MNSLQFTPLFQGIAQEDIEKMTVCFQAEKKSFKEKQPVFVYGRENSQIGLLYKGAVSLNRVQADGTLDLMEYIEGTGIFGAPLAFSPLEDEFEVVCEKDAKILFIDKAHITKRCENACPHHSQVVENLLFVMAEKVAALSEKLDVLSHRTIRGKLLHYFQIQSNKKKSATFSLPFSFLALSNYLCVDRSAMMRELKKMREDELISIDGKRVTILD